MEGRCINFKKEKRKSKRWKEGALIYLRWDNSKNY